MDALTRLVSDYLAHLRVERGASANTQLAYRRDLDRYLEFLVNRGMRDLGQVQEPDVREFLVHLGQTNPPLAMSSRARTLIAVRGLHKFALAEGAVSFDVAEPVTPPALGMRLPKALSREAVEQLLASPDASTIVGLRDQAVLELLYGTGVRVSELVGLDVDDVRPVLDEPDRGLRILGKGNKERFVLVGSFARQAIEAYLTRGRPELVARAKKPGPALFLNKRGSRLSRQSVWQLLQEHAADIDESVSPHSLRHSFATHLLDGGADIRVVQELLGHSSVTTTQIYTLVTAEHMREVYRTCHPRAY